LGSVVVRVVLFASPIVASPKRWGNWGTLGVALG